YAIMIGTPVSALTTSSQLMTVAVTGAMALIVGDSLAAGPAAEKDTALISAANALATLRSDAAVGFSDALTHAVASLGMQSSSFMLAISDLPRNAWASEATQHIELLYCPGATMSPRPLAKIASGGELSRVMLALKGEVNVADNVTLVFDEIDSGVGGSTANLVAHRLAELSSNHQVIVVTHLPQIAVFADAHLVVEKDTKGAVPRTVLREVRDEARTVEISRMLSGDEEGVSLEHARTLLEQVRVR
ncbi:MAG: DNA repair protein RecN, partial [Actinobacteria bacterium]|nr:DNA repair protein RecN [Actinomycetota bacterium]